MDRRQPRLERREIANQTPLLDRERAQPRRATQGAARRGDEKASEFAEHRGGEYPVYGIQRGDVRRGRDQHKRSDALGICDREPGRDRTAEAVTGNRRFGDAGRIKGVDCRPRVAGEIHRLRCAIPSRAVDRHRRGPLAERSDDACPVASGPGLAVEQQNRVR